MSLTVIPNHRGWAPSSDVIRRLRRTARKRGLKDFDAVAITEAGAIICSSMDDEELSHHNLMIVKVKGRWKFMTDSEYLES